MRNLKKILALVLALVMSLSLMATAGAKGFEDSDKVGETYQTAVEVLNGLGVFGGYDLGNGNFEFRPQNNITRAEVATIIYRIVTGDVKGEQAAIYTDMANSKLKDLNQAEWARGFVNYCYNAGIIKGVNDTDFEPNSNITGYAALTMILRAIGYGQNGEFVGDQWEINTASRARELGLLSGITDAQLGQPASRELVAQVLFRTILKETVTWTALNGYQTTGTTLAKSVLGLEEIEGVILGNEYADLQSGKVLPEGKTQLDDKRIDYTTSFEDIGERKLVYLKDGKTVLSIADSTQNTRESTLDATKLSDLLDKANLTTNDETEHFINFDNYYRYTTPYRIRYVLQVEVDDSANRVLVGTDLDAQDVADAIDWANADAAVAYDDTKDNAISVTLKPKSFVSDTDLDWMEYIFADGDLTTKTGDEESTSYDVGEIYVNTQSTKDISDDPDYYFEKFVETFMELDENVNVVSDNENGNWLKVIDNDADGVADYVLKVLYTGAQVERIKNDTITLDVKNHALLGHDRLSAAVVKNGIPDSGVNTLTTQKVVSEDELAVDDVVYYAIIDGVARTYKADMVTATIDKINRNTKSTTTMDGDEYFESAVCDHILNPEYANEVTDLVGNVSFDLFFDRGGYLLTFIKSNIAGDFKLITDGWFNSTKSGDEYAVRVYNDEESKQEIVDLTSGGNLFIGRDVVYIDSKGVTHTTDNNDWDALKYFGATADIAADSSALDNNMAGAPNYNPKQIQAGKTPADLNGGYVTDLTTLHNRIKTTVASVSEDGRILPVEDYRITGRYDHLMIALSNDKIPTSSYSTGTPYVTGANSGTAYNVNPVDADSDPITSVELRALNNTKYYVVWPDGNNVGVKAFTGYASAGDITKLVSTRGTKDLALVEDIYAVGTQTVRENDHRDDEVYYTADVVVIELNQPLTNARDIVLLVDDEGQVSSTGLRHVQVIEPDGSSNWIDVNGYQNTQLLSNSSYARKLQPGLYWRSEAGEDVYTLEALTDEEIRNADCFITGQVQTVVKTGSKDYVIVNPAADQYSDNTVITVDTADENTVEPIITENAKFYTLGYGGADAAHYKRNAANLSDEDAEDYGTVLDSKVEGTPRGSAGNPAQQREFYIDRDHMSYFYNDVLIRYNSDGEIVWAVSFQNAYNAAGDADFAQRVWENVAPAAEEVEESDITFENVTVKGVAVVDGAVTVAKSVAGASGTNGLKFDTNADSATVVGGTSTGGLTGGTWTENAGAISANKSYTIVLRKAGCADRIEQIDVTVAAGKSIATINSIKIKGVEVTNIPAAVDGAATITTPFVINSSDNLGDDPIIEVVTTDPNASWAATNAGGTISEIASKNNNNYSSATGKLTAGTDTDKIVVTVTADDGTTTIAYTLHSVTAKLLTLKKSGTGAGTATYGDDALDTTGVEIADNADIVLTVTPDAGKEVTQTKYTVGGNTVTVNYTSDTVTIPSSALSGKDGDVEVEVITADPALQVKVSSATDTAGSTVKIAGNAVTTDATDTKVSNRADVVFTVEASAATEYVKSVTYKIGTADPKPITAGADGSYKILASELTGATALEIDVTEDTAAVITGKAGDDNAMKVDAGDGKGFVAVDNSAKAYVAPNTVIKVKVAEGFKPAFDDTDNYEISEAHGDAATGTDWVWTVTVKGDITLTGLIEL